MGKGNELAISINPDTSTVFMTNPQGDSEVMELHAKAVQLKEYAELKRITDDADVAVATGDLGQIATVKKMLKERQTAFTAPLENCKKAIIEAFREVSAPILEADGILRGKVLEYQQEQARIRAEQAEINRLKQEALDRETQLKGAPSEPVELITVNEEKPTRVVTAMGAIGQRKNMKWRLVDFALLPDSYKLPDSAKITKLVKGGGTIEGIEIYDDPILTVKATP